MTVAAPPLVLAPHVATLVEVVERMLDLAGVGPDDVVYDLGCGDGRIAIAAAKRGARAWGCDHEPYWVDEARRAAREAGVADRATFEVADAMAVDARPATVVALYLVEWSTRKLGEKLLAELAPGARIVSHNFPIGDDAPARSERLRDASGVDHAVLCWVAGGAGGAVRGVAATPIREPEPAGPVELHDLRLEHLAPRLGERFSLDEPEPGRATWTLAEASPLAAGTAPPGAFRGPFRLIFHGPPAPVRQQGIVPLVHAALGRLEIFVVPIGPDAATGAMRYEAIFT